MSEVVKGLLSQVAALSDDERNEFLDELDELLGLDEQAPLTEDELIAELEQRAEDVKSGRMASEPADQVMREIREFGR